MGLLESMRSSTDSTFMQVVLIAAAASFMGWTAMPQGDKTSVVATVNGVSIMDTEYRQLYSRQKAATENELDRTLSDAEEQRVGAQVRQQLIRNEALLQQAQAVGLEVSEYEIERVNARAGQAAGYVSSDGEFNEEKYQRYLQQRGLTEGRYKAQMDKSLTLGKLQELVFLGSNLSEPVLRRTFEQNQRKVAVRYVNIRSTAFYSSIEVSDDEADTWLTENATEAQETYDADFQRLYNHPEQLQIQMLKLVVGDGQTGADLLPRMNGLRGELTEGADFKVLARRHSEDPSAESGGDLGLRPILQLSNEITREVEGLAEGDISRVVSSATDLRVYKLVKRVAPYEESFEDVKRKIAGEAIRKEKAPGMAIEFAENEVLPAWKEKGEAPLSLLESKGFKLSTTGLKPATAPRGPLDPPASLMSMAADLPEGAVLDQVFQDAGRYWVAQVSERKEADMTQFEAQRTNIRNQELFTRRNQFLENWSTDVVAKSIVQ